MRVALRPPATAIAAALTGRARGQLAVWLNDQFGPTGHGLRVDSNGSFGLTPPVAAGQGQARHRRTPPSELLA